MMVSAFDLIKDDVLGSLKKSKKINLTKEQCFP